MNVDEAKATLAKLEAKLVEETNRATELATERRKLSFLGLTGNEAARAKLDELNTEFVTSGLEAGNIRAAIDEARHRLAAAQREAELARQRESARQAKAIITVASKRGPKMAEGLRVLCEELNDFRDDVRALGRFGAPVSDYRLTELWLMRAIFPALRAAGLEIDVTPPGMRGDLAKIGDIYLQNASRWVAETLDVDVAASAEREVA
jgi:hypothetical protein